MIELVTRCAGEEGAGDAGAWTDSNGAHQVAAKVAKAAKVVRIVRPSF